MLEAKDLTLAPAYRDVRFEARAGEVLGVYGFMGCGQLELARTLFGKHAARERIARDRRQAGGRSSNTTAAKQAGVAYVAGEPPRDAVQRRADLQEHLDRGARAPVEMALLKPDREREIAREQVKDARHPPAQRRVAPGRLSPAAISRRSRWRNGSPTRRAFSCSPNRRAAWTSAPRRTWCGSCAHLRDQGIAIIVFSTEPETVLSLADRVAGDAQGRDRARIRRRSDQQGSAARRRLTKDQV